MQNLQSQGLPLDPEANALDYLSEVDRLRETIRVLRESDAKVLQRAEPWAAVARKTQMPAEASGAWQDAKDAHTAAWEAFERNWEALSCSGDWRKFGVFSARSASAMSAVGWLYTAAVLGKVHFLGLPGCNVAGQVLSNWCS